MRPAEVEIDGELVKNRLVTDVFSELRTAIEGTSFLDSLDYFEISMPMQNRKDALSPNFEWLSCAPVASGGHHYVYIGNVFNGWHRLNFVGKTSGGFERACEVANRCALELGPKSLLHNPIDPAHGHPADRVNISPRCLSYMTTNTEDRSSAPSRSVWSRRS